MKDSFSAKFKIFVEVRTAFGRRRVSASVAFLADAFSRGRRTGRRVEFERRFSHAPKSRSVFRNFNERGRAERRSAASTV